MSETHSHRGATPTRSWRRIVADALALAQSAVELDTTKTDRAGALRAYAESVQRLRSIRARLERHGAHAEARQLATIVRLTFSRDYLRSDPRSSATSMPSGCASCPQRARCHRHRTSTKPPSLRSAAIVLLCWCCRLHFLSTPRPPTRRNLDIDYQRKRFPPTTRPGVTVRRFLMTSHEHNKCIMIFLRSLHTYSTHSSWTRITVNTHSFPPLVLSYFGFRTTVLSSKGLTVTRLITIQLKPAE